MLSSNQIKYLRSLQQKKFRQKYNNFIVEGDKMCVEIMREHGAEIEHIYALSHWIETNKKNLEYCLNKTITITEKELQRISALKSPNDVLIVMRQWQPQMESERVAKSLSLYLDEIQDPGNLGTILRIADWFGIEYVFCSVGCAELYNLKVIQASMGAFLRVKCITSKLTDLCDQFPDLLVLGAVIDGENVYTAGCDSKGLLVIGNEGRGIAASHMPLLSRRISIPRRAGSGAESLNAAVATGILCAALLNR